MAFSSDGDPFRHAIAALLEESSGREAASWSDPATVASHLAALAACGIAFAYGGAGMSDLSAPDKSGLITQVEVQGSQADAVLILQVGDFTLTLRFDSLTLAYVPQAHDTADAGFLLTAVADDDVTRAWERPGRLGAPRIELVIGLADGLLIGAARSIAIRHPLFAAQLRKALAGGIYRPHDTERLKDEAEAKQYLKSLYAGHRANRLTGPMTQDDLHFVGWEALKLGLQPTVELVRDVHGRGSPSVLHPMLKSFYGTLVQDYLQPAPLPPVPKPLLRFWTALAAEVRAAGEVALMPAREALAASDRALEARAETLAQERQRFEDEQRIAAAASVERERHVQSLETRVASLESDLTVSRNAICGYELELAGARSDRQHAEQALSDARAEVARHQEATEAAKVLCTALQSRVASLSDEVDRSVRVEAALRTDATNLQRQLGTRDAELVSARADAQRRATECTGWRTEAERGRDAMRERTVELAAAEANVKRLSPLMEKLETATRETVSLRATLLATSAERDRLADLARSRPVKTPRNTPRSQG